MNDPIKALAVNLSTSDIEEKILDFLKNRDEIRGTWLKNKSIQLYVRNSFRFFNKNLDDRFFCFDFATIDINPYLQRQGIFKRLLNFIIENDKKHNAIFIENVLNPRLYSHILKREDCFETGSYCFYRLLDNQNIDLTKYKYLVH